MLTASPLPEFIQQVRNALAHLYDYAYLQNHPLALQLTAGQHLDEITRAQKVRRALLDQIEALKPHGHANAGSQSTVPPSSRPSRRQPGWSGMPTSPTGSAS